MLERVTLQNEFYNIHILMLKVLGGALRVM